MHVSHRQNTSIELNFVVKYTAASAQMCMFKKIQSDMSFMYSKKCTYLIITH